MKFSDIVDQASALLQRKGRVTYRALKLEFDLDDERRDVLKDELIDAQEVAADKDGDGESRPQTTVPDVVPAEGQHD